MNVSGSVNTGTTAPGCDGHLALSRFWIPDQVRSKVGSADVVGGESGAGRGTSGKTVYPDLAKCNVKDCPVAAISFILESIDIPSLAPTTTTARPRPASPPGLLLDSPRGWYGTTSPPPTKPRADLNQWCTSDVVASTDKDMRAVMSCVSERKARVEGDRGDSWGLGEVGGEAYRDMGAELALLGAGILVGLSLINTSVVV